MNIFLSKNLKQKKIPHNENFIKKLFFCFSFLRTLILEIKYMPSVVKKKNFIKLIDLK